MRMRFVALGLGMVVLTAGWFFVGFKPASSELKEVKAQVETTQSQVAALKTRLAALQELQRNEKQLRADAARMEKGLPDTPSVSDYIRQVQQIANEAGLDFLSIAPSAPSDVAGAAAAPAPAASPAPGASPAPAAAAPAPAVNPLKTIAVSLNANGSFFEIESFVAKMEDLERAVRIDTFNLSGNNAEGAGSTGLTLAIKLQMFMQQGASVPAPAAAG